MDKSWWSDARPPAAVRSDSHEWIFQWAQQVLALKAMDEGQSAPIRVGAAGPVRHPDVYKELVAILKEAGASLSEESFYVWDDDFEEVYVWPSGAAFLTSADESVQLGANVVTTDAELAEKVRAFLHANIYKSQRTNRGRVYILVATNEGVRPNPLGFAAVPLEIDNYDPSIQQAVYQAVSDLQTPFPDGRLTILEGPPGCGKTFLIRSLVHEIPGAKFIFVPPAMVSSLGDPSMVSALLSLQEESSDEESSGPTVLICEDADSILAQRQSDNMPAISSVLNLTSGLLGDVIDIRVVATTNASKSDIDPALLRNGRLAQYIQVVPLEKSQATSILRRLLDNPAAEQDWPAARVPSFGRSRRSSVGFSSDGGEEILKDKVLLADVFKVAKKEGWKPKKAKAKVDVTKIVPRRPRPYKEEDGAQFLVDKKNGTKSKGKGAPATLGLVSR